MKKIFFIAIVLIYTLGFSQNSNEKLILQKNIWSIGGSISFTTSSHSENNDYEYEDLERLNINFLPKVSYAIQNNLFMGVELEFGYSNSKFNSSDESSSVIVLGIAPNIKKYFPVGEKLTLNLLGEFRYNYSKTKNHDSESNNYFVGIRPGITYFINKKIALEANIGKLGYWNSKYENSSSNGFEFSMNTSDINFGVSCYL